MNKEQIYQLLEESFGEEEGSYLDTSPMNHLSKQDAGDPKFMLRLVREFIGFEDDILSYLEEPAKSDIDFIENCINSHSKYSTTKWGYLRYASERIKNDSSLFIKWIKESESLHCLNFAEFSIQTNQEIQNLIKDYLETNWDLVKYCHPSMRDDITIMKKAIADNGLNLEFASDELKKNKDFLLSAVEENQDAVKFIPSNFLESEIFVKDLIEKVNSVTNTIFELIPEKLKKNKSILIKIAQKIQYLGQKLEGYFDKNDLQFFSEVVKKNGDFIYFASEKLRDDEELVKVAIKFGDCSLSNISERLRNDPEMVIWAIENNRPALLSSAGEIAKDDFDVIKTAVCRQGSALDWASERLRDDNEIVKLAVDEDPYALKYASERIRNDKTFVLKICEKEIHAYIYAGDSLWSDKDFALFVAPKVANCLDHFSSKIQKDPDVLSVYYNENLN